MLKDRFDELGDNNARRRVAHTHSTPVRTQAERLSVRTERYVERMRKRG